ncbi:hypothetical protein [Microvirga makkahensis]|uniref:Uncharacterized protein n=1 Tax=Microvirga makkahensis TaxID=1128670 RepID=A0A7X3SQR5_9HYPH|nr:hypothetical protein [Microvirga makkahensis]MXQ13548.1 hypothetical protein [Microvirga makkahensis]
MNNHDVKVLRRAVRKAGTLEELQEDMDFLLRRIEFTHTDMLQWATWIKDWIYTRRAQYVSRSDLSVACLWSVDRDAVGFSRNFDLTLEHLIKAEHLKPTKWHDGRTDMLMTQLAPGFYTRGDLRPKD